MRTLIIIAFLFFANLGISQINAKQIKGGSPVSTLWIMGTDTVTGSNTRGLGKWYSISDLFFPNNDSTFTTGDSICVINMGDTTCVSQDSFYLTDTSLCVITMGDTICSPYSTTTVPISSLFPAVNTNTINNLNYKQEWQWNTLGANSGLKLSSTSTGAASNLQRLLDIALSGANSTSGQNTIGLAVANTHTGTTSTNYGIRSTATGGTSANIGISGETDTGIGIKGLATTGFGAQFQVDPSSTNTLVEVAELVRSTSGTAANGLGGYLRFNNETSTGALQTSAIIGSTWTDATNATRTSDLQFHTTNSATNALRATLAGTGQWTWNSYTTSNFNGGLEVDSVLVSTSAGVIKKRNAATYLWTIDADDADTELIGNETVKFEGLSGIQTDYVPSTNTLEIECVSCGGGDGIYGGDGTAPSDVDVAITDNIDFGGCLLYLDNATNEIGMGTCTPDYQLDIESNAVNVMLNDLDGTTGNMLMLRTDVSLDGTDIFGGISFQYTDSGSSDAWDLEGFRREDAVNNSTITLRANEDTDANVLMAEKNSNWTANTTESHLAINAGIALTQNYEYTSTVSDLTLDRSYYNIFATGSGTLTEELLLPEVASTSDNWDGSITSAQVQVGQQYVVSNFRASTGLKVTAFSGDKINSTATDVTVPFGDSWIFICVRFSGGVGYWFTYD